MRTHLEAHNSMKVNYGVDNPGPLQCINSVCKVANGPYNSTLATHEKTDPSHHQY